jgi:hypothetical protein
MGKSYILRTCSYDMTSHDGAFTWPTSGPVEAPDWDTIPECGGGLHGFLNGCGNGALADWNESAKWLVVEVDLEGKVKFPKGEVVFCGTREEAIAKLEALAPETKHLPVIGAIRVVDDNMHCHAGDYGKATAGDYGTATADYRGTATAGDYGTANAGHFGTATAGERGNATAGYDGTATAGNEGTATAGDYGTAIAGVEGTATAGDSGIISIYWYDITVPRKRISIGYVGENGILANTPYKCDVEGKLVPASRSS